MTESQPDLVDNVHPGGYTLMDWSRKVSMSQVMSATKARRRFGEVMRRVASEGEPVIVE
jgi:hypothetical protein